ncbi:MAG: MmgE/PrpD family protein [Candidatus Binataceae bacterium]|jgi:2-methylcitrate dehydratase PrpD
MSVTKELASWIVASRPEQIPPSVYHEARRAILNYVGCALGGCREDAVDIAIKAMAPYFGNPIASVLGRAERMDPLHASLINGISSHVLDFDDTTPTNYIHPSSPVASALFAYASTTPVTGAALMHAFVLGFEAESRIGNAVYPAHYDAGWHITGTAGVFGAAVAIAKLLDLPLQEMVWAIGLAATQSAGLREMFGSMGKAFHPGRAAQNGYAAALLAQAGFTSGEFGIEGPRGFAHVTSASYDLSKVTAKLGSEFNFSANTYKPFPCGIVIHPTIDACIQIHRERKLSPRDIRAVELKVAPLVLDLCNKQRISRGLEGKFSVFHAAAIGLVRGNARIAEFTDDTVNDPDVKRVRELAVATGDPRIGEDQATVEVTLASGERIVKHVEHAIGNLARPMTDRELEEKFRDQAASVLAPERMNALIATCWKIDTLADCRGLIAAATR